MMRLRYFSKKRSLLTIMVGALGVLGCSGGSTGPKPPDKPFLGTKLVVGVVGDSALLPSIKAQRGEWAARTGADLVVLDEPVDPKAVAKSAADVLVFPGDRMGDLVDAKALAVLGDSVVTPPVPTSEGAEPAPEPPPDDLKFKDVVLAYRDQVTRYGPDRMALPIGGSALVVAFHRAAFDNPANKAAAKAAGLALEPPGTWEQFDALARFFQGRDWDGDGSPESGVAIAWGPDLEGVGDAVLAARVAALGLHRDQFSFLLDSETTDPRVTSPPFVEGLKAFVALKASGPPGAEKYDADAARKAFASGEVVAERHPLLVIILQRKHAFVRAVGVGQEFAQRIGVFEGGGLKRLEAVLLIDGGDAGQERPLQRHIAAAPILQPAGDAGLWAELAGRVGSVGHGSAVSRKPRSVADRRLSGKERWLLPPRLAGRKN